MNGKPARLSPPSNRAADRCCPERKNAEKQEMKVNRPSNERERGHRKKYDEETPIIDVPSGRVPASALGRQHRNDASEDTNESSGDVNGNDAEEYRRRRRNWNA